MAFEVHYRFRCQNSDPRNQRILNLLKNLDEKWSERFARLEAMFLARSFAVPVEPVQNGDVVVTDRPFIPPVQQTTCVTGQRQTTFATSQMEMKKATQPVEAPGAATATQPVEVLVLPQRHSPLPGCPPACCC